MFAAFYFIIYLFGVILNWLTTVGVCLHDEMQHDDRRLTQSFLIAITV